ncbi:MAG: 23S rRNA (guanosine(2251)-2'-O)-methyltransferase RlmB [Marinilabiliaceae bacterium]|nr:23S rRNA (guanosine(2251)-2'-O)-methyltransferase RlmB [Marinilabiliaceae bacterium]
MKNEIYGIRTVLEAIESGQSIEKIYAKVNLSGELFNQLRKTAKNHNIPILKVPLERINKFTTGNHQGVVAIVSPVNYHNIENIVEDVILSGKEFFIIVLDGITDVRNFGAIARTAEAAGVHAIVIPEKGSAPVNSDAIKTSAGALFRIPVCRVAKPWYTLKFLKEKDAKIIAITEKTDTDYKSINYKGNLVLIFGAEDKGISPQLLKMCDLKAAIPTKGKTASLNVSVAAGIVIFEAVSNV